METNQISVRQYDFLIEKGILTKYDRVELLNGEIVEKMPKTPIHCALNDRAMYMFFRLLDEKAERPF